ncbi:translation initiation factor IF-2 [Calditerrivibrio nitroreducens]|uniref:Translation initiation factor IF-2 n=1 Tax=Calditerrivibrio nitroreducens (strain DSM 19672 / NBRC 101217 / Yu37-1) TaxID=768670 RepID=E4TJE1_CALNY|nr:translation initiation factor IF-2 [Calditerrivibrio nitroreducens]ADR19208.1 translation initiation factor IF-2 [Calditerrivibrio nitroreducens DSM 19672]
MNRFRISELVRKGLGKFDEISEKLKSVGVAISSENDEVTEEQLASAGFDIKRISLDKRQELIKQAMDRRKRHSKVTEVIVKDQKSVMDDTKKKLTKEELLKKKLELEKSLQKVDEEREKLRDEKLKAETKKDDTVSSNVPDEVETSKNSDIILENKSIDVQVSENDQETINKSDEVQAPSEDEKGIDKKSEKISDEVLVQKEEIVIKTDESQVVKQKSEEPKTHKKEEHHKKPYQGKKPWEKRPHQDRKDASSPQGQQREDQGRQQNRPDNRSEARKGDHQRGGRPPYQGQQRDGGSYRDRPSGGRPQGDRPQGGRPQGDRAGFDKGKRTDFKKEETSSKDKSIFSPMSDVLIEDKELIVKKKKWEEDVPSPIVEEKDIESKKIKVKKSSSKKEKNLKQNLLEDLELLQIETGVIEPEPTIDELEEIDQKPKKQAKLKDRDREKEKEVVKEVKQPSKPTRITIGESITVSDLAGLLGIRIPDIIKKLMTIGIMATANQSIDAETVQLIAMDYGIDVEVKTISEEDLLPNYESKPENLKPRPPIVTVMGHVDHGKTSLLDAIRKTKVAEKEAGGITQHIGAYEVDIDRGKIVFLDTPGHEAFTTLRARGANVTDIVILVVAADDGVMPQTKEAIDHAKAAGVKIVVAINKIDKPNANPERVKTQLAEYGIIPEEWGGEYQFQEISAKNRINIDDLLERVLLEAELLELKGDYVKPAEGIIIESRLDKQKGVSVTLIVKDGVLKVGDIFVAGTHYGKVRALYNYAGRSIKEAGPSIPVELMGFSEVPEPGETLIVLPNEKLAKQIVEIRLQKQREKDEAARAKLSLDDIFNKIKEGEIKDLNIILKADVQGSLEALKSSLAKLSNSEVKVKIIHDGVGGINESDVLLALASKAIIIGFNVRPDAKARTVAEREKIDIRLYSVIYEAIEEVQKAIEGMLKPELKENIIGKVEIRKVFNVPKVGKVAGCYVLEGKIVRNSNVRIIRDNIVIYTGKINSLKRFQDDVKEVVAGYECGLGIANYNDIKEGDILEVFEIVEEKRLLKDVE